MYFLHTSDLLHSFSTLSMEFLKVASLLVIFLNGLYSLPNQEHTELGTSLLEVRSRMVDTVQLFRYQRYKSEIIEASGTGLIPALIGECVLSLYLMLPMNSEMKQDWNLTSCFTCWLVCDWDCQINYSIQMEWFTKMEN